MTQRLFSFSTPFRALFITLTEIKKSVIYDGKRRRFVERKDEILLEIELNDASVKPCWMRKAAYLPAQGGMRRGVYSRSRIFRV
jgi:hypothetical protein